VELVPQQLKSGNQSSPTTPACQAGKDSDTLHTALVDLGCVGWRERLPTTTP
jgi:hypothetical protein